MIGIAWLQQILNKIGANDDAAAMNTTLFAGQQQIKNDIDNLGNIAIEQFDTENADRNLTSLVTVLTDTPDAANPTICQGLIFLGDGTKNLTGGGGLYDVVVTVGDQVVQPSPMRVNFDDSVRAAVKTTAFPVPANAEVILKVKSSNSGDTDVDVTAYLIGYK